MPPYAISHAHYNKEFARAVIRAYVMGSKYFRFKNKIYDPINHINNVREDIINGYYRIKVTTEVCFKLDS